MERQNSAAPCILAEGGGKPSGTPDSDGWADNGECT